MIDSPDSHRPNDRQHPHSRPDALASPPMVSAGTVAGTVAGMATPPLVRHAVRGLRELEFRDPRSRRPGTRVEVALSAGTFAATDEEWELRTGLLAELRAGTTLQVCALRARGEPPERVLCAMKTMFRDAMAAEGWRDPRATEPLMRRVVRWSIEAYYDR